MGARKLEEVSVEEIENFKFNLFRARLIAAEIQNGMVQAPVHLQTIAEKGVKFRIKKGHDTAAAYSILGEEKVYSKFSPRLAKQ